LVDLSGSITVADSMVNHGHRFALKREGSGLFTPSINAESYAASVPAGIYDVYYDLYPGGGNEDYGEPNPLTPYPVNLHGRVGCIDLQPR
jgi:hypothetical protein